MINIRPVSDLRNKFPEIEEIVVNSNTPVFLTKNGYGTMVLISVNNTLHLQTTSNINWMKQTRPQRNPRSVIPLPRYLEE